MASSSSSHQYNVQHIGFSGIEPDTQRRKVSESSRLFDVFINHRGPDAKETLAVPLYNSLQQLGLRAFLDREEKEVGEYFPSTIETAIRSASAHIAIFSERYAESAWCLAELDLMLQSGAKIFPIFYGVKPSELRYIESGAYADAFRKYKEKGRYLLKLETWEKALQSASLITGLEINSADPFRDSKAFKNLVLDLQKEVERTKPLFVAQHPVALPKLVKDFESQCLDKLVHDFENQCGLNIQGNGLNIQGNDHSKIVGIFGMGGVGKTTLAKELFNRKRLKYMATCFLCDVRERSSRFGLPSLQAKLLKDLFHESPPEFEIREDGSNYVRDCLRRSRFLSFLIVVDDIDNVKQLDALCLMDMANNSHNSLVIVTTRDVGVLTSAGITNRYNLRGLNRDDAREQFCWHSFGKPKPASGYENLVDAFVDVCGGLPLSLQILGRHVHGRPVYYWELQLCKVRESLHPDIKDILKISFDALNRVEKQIFMDIACFFVDESRDTAITVWEGSGWHARHALETLKDRCLVEESERLDISLWEDKSVVLKMHDHLRDLGREMSEELNSPPRHWSPKHRKYLETKGFENILAQTKGRSFHSFYDTSMGSRITYFIGQSEECAETPSSLLWLQLNLHCSKLSSIPPWIPLQNLQCLRISYGCLKRLWHDVQAPSQLKELQMYQTTLEEFPDFSGISNNLERVVLDANYLPIQGWSLLESLKVYPRSLLWVFFTLYGELACNNMGDKTTFKSSCFTRLVIRNFLKLSDEMGVYSIGESTALKRPLSNLENLEINHQIYVTKILICGNYCPSLLSLKISRCPELEKLSLTHLRKLVNIDLKCCEKLKEVDIKYCAKLQNITFPPTPISLSVEDCTELYRIEGIDPLTELRGMNIRKRPSLSRTNCLEVIEIDWCGKLEFEELRLRGMQFLQRITLGTNVKVKFFELNSCQNLETIMFGCEKLIELRIQGCPKLVEVPAFRGANCLERVIIDGCREFNCLILNKCRNLVSVSGNFMEITKELFISGCNMLEELPMLDTGSCLKSMSIRSCEKLQIIMLPKTLVRLSIQDCRDLKRLSLTGDFMEITHDLIISGYNLLEELPMLDTGSCLERMSISNCEKLQNIMLPTTLVSLSIQECRDLKRLSVTGDFIEITKKLFISGCNMLEELPMLDTGSCSERMSISNCEKLQNIMLPKTLFCLSIWNCRDLKRLSVTGDFMGKTEELFISGCNMLEEIQIEDSENITGIEELRGLRCMRLNYCSNAFIRNCIHTLKSVPPDGLYMIGRAVEGAESSLKESLFSDANISVETVMEFGTHQWLESRTAAIIACFAVVIDRFTSVQEINENLRNLTNIDIPYKCLELGFKVEVREGEWMITMVACDIESYCYLQAFEDTLREYRILKKGFGINLEEGEEPKIIGVLRIIVDSVYHV